MSSALKLTERELQLIRLVAKDKGEDGWTRVSEALTPYVVSTYPPRFITLEIETEKPGSRAKLTTDGETILWAMQFLC